MRNKIRIATRGSKLALWQAEGVKSELKRLYPDLNIGLKKIQTTGDKIFDVPLAKIGGKGLFVKEIEETLLREDAELAVHSMKDIPTDLPKGLHLAAICKREDPRDALITKIRNSKFEIRNFKDLPHGARIGTSSLRRTCQLLNIRPDLKIVQLRGNLDTRIKKLDEGQFDAIIVATAGVKRLGMSERISEILGYDISLPAIGQGAIGIECRIDNDYINNLLKPLNHPETAVCVQAERVFLKKLEGGCQVPIAAYARIISQESESNSKLNLSLITCLPSRQAHHSLLIIDGLVGSVSGDTIIRGSVKGKSEDAEHLGIKLAEDLILRGAGKILSEVYKK